MSRPARAAQAPDTEERLARRTVSAAAGLVIGAGVAVVAPLAGPAGAASDFNEQVVVNAADPDGTTTEAALLGGATYELIVEGVFAFPGGDADAECRRAEGSLVWVAEDGAPSLELLVDGGNQQWVPVGPSVLGCDTSSHRYRLGWTPNADGPLTLRVDGGGDQERLEGSLVVTVTGPAVVEGAPGNEPADDASTEAPSEPSPPPSDVSGDPATDGTAAPSADEQPPPVEVAPSVVGRSPSAASLAPDEPAAPTTPNLPDAGAARPAATVRREDLAALLLGGAAPTPPPVTVELTTGLGRGAATPSPAGASMPLLLAAALVGAAAVGLALPPRSLGRLRPSLPRRRQQPHPWRPAATRPGPARASALERSLF